MTDPKASPPRLVETEASRQQGELAVEGAEAFEHAWPETAQAAVYRRLLNRLEAEQPPNRLLWLSSSVAVVATLSLALVLVREPRRPPSSAATQAEADERVITLGQEARLELTSDTDIELPHASSGPIQRRVVLRRGKLCARVAHRDLEKQGPLIVEAGKLTVTVIGTQFCVAMDRDLATVSVSEGRVRAEGNGGRSAEVAAGESLRSDDARLVAAATLRPSLPPFLAEPAPTAPAMGACVGAGSFVARSACYRRVAQGADIAAENALYGLGLLERDEAHDGRAALATFRTYLERFPRGVFVPEASLASLGELVKEERYAEALVESDRYLQSGEEALRSPVELVRAQMLLGPLGRPQEALPVLRRLVDSGPPMVREDALFGLGFCVLSLDQRTEAVALFDRYLTDFPDGKHVAEIHELER